MAYEFRATMDVPAPIERVFEFFSDAFNLQEITPPFLDFKVLTPKPVEMRQGRLLDYRIRLHGIPIKWRTEITCWEPPFRFVDEQLKGPYRQWIHTHTFEAIECGTRIGDHVRYNHWGTRIAERFFVRPDIESIFAYRQKRIRELLLTPAKAT